MHCAKGLPDCGVMKSLRCREEGDLALEVEDEAGGDFQHSGLKPTEDRFMRLDDMERFVRFAEQREMDDDEDEEEQTGDDSGDDHILTISRHMHAEMRCICPRQSTMAASPCLYVFILLCLQHEQACSS